MFSLHSHCNILGCEAT